ncbi:MAG: alpha/beta hydrolase [Dehalococcoidia bacterium]|nr:alpha/beta hydrolase [Dehalococcoidia bacterium]
MQPESRFVESNGVNHHYLEWGSPDNPSVVMFHAVGMSSQIWNNTARDLARDYNVHSFDLRGHGDTEHPEGGFTFQQIGQDTASVIQALGLEGSIAVGHSAGGMSLLIADSMFPGIVSKGVLVDTRVGDSPMALLSPEEQKLRMERTLQKRSIWGSRKAMHEAYRDRRVFKPWEDEVFADYIDGNTRLLDDGTVELKCKPYVEEEFYSNRRHLDTLEVLRGLGGEYVLLVGDYEGAQTPQDAAVQHLQQETKGFQLKELGAGSHFVPMEHPALVLKEIRNFID